MILAAQTMGYLRLLELTTLKTLRIAMKINKIMMTHGQELTSESHVKDNYSRQSFHLNRRQARSQQSRPKGNLPGVDNGQATVQDNHRLLLGL